jgi:UDP-N-acetylmuramate dehydrogenase
MQPRTFRRDECAFGYRDSFFKTPDGRHYCIVRVTFGLTQQPAPNLSYRDVREYFASRKIGEPSLREMRAAIGEIRAAKFPDLSVCGTAGSFFKNPVLSRKEAENLGKRYPDMPLFPMSEGCAKASLAWILDHLCGLSGTREGDVGSFHMQPLVIVNYGNATASDIKAFTQKIERDVYARTGITIVPEVVYV